MEITEVRIKDIDIGERRRPLGDITRLMQNIEEVGLIQPIVVTEGMKLVVGLHRLEACRALGWVTIPTMVLGLDETDAAIMEIDENLVRHELTQLERSELTIERKRLYEKKTPLHQGKKLTVTGDGRFVKDTVEKTGRSERAVEKDIQIARNIPPAVREVIKDTSLADNQTKLVGLARVVKKTPEIADQILAEINEGRDVEAVVKEKLGPPPPTVESNRNIIEEAARTILVNPVKSLHQIDMATEMMQDLWPDVSDNLNKLIEVLGREQTDHIASRFVQAMPYLTALMHEFQARLELKSD